MTRQTVFVFAAPALLALACGVTPTRAEDEPDYPHGDYNEDCSTCHTGDGFKPAVIAKDFRHTATFPLRGAHATAKCRDCHKSLEFKKTTTLCADCHRDPHIGELGADCGRCHTPRNFIDRTAQLDAHRLTRFPLTGAHVTRDCQECHLPAPQGQLQYVNTPVDCQACHLPLYQATTDPNHVAAGFPTDCSQCHTPTSFEGARFTQHDALYFPIYSGVHNGRWDSCNTCHNIPSNYSIFNCLGCHTNPGTSSRHDDVPGFSYNSNACYACHPNGRAGD